MIEHCFLARFTIFRLFIGLNCYPYMHIYCKNFVLLFGNLVWRYKWYSKTLLLMIFLHMPRKIKVNELLVLLRKHHVQQRIISFLYKYTLASQRTGLNPKMPLFQWKIFVHYTQGPQVLYSKSVINKLALMRSDDFNNLHKLQGRNHT